MNEQIRHGDVFVRQIETIPTDATNKALAEPTVLAYGEVTGHAHRIISDGAVTQMEHDGKAYVLLEQAGILSHEEHGQIDMPAGAYEVIVERDYDPSEYARQVID